MKKNYIVIATVVAFVGLFAVAASFYNKQKGEELTSASEENLAYLLRDYSPRMGPENAKVTIVEFFDPACGTCNAFYPLVKQIMKENPGKVNLVLRYLPFHKNSDVIVSIFEAARLQGRFRQSLELAYKTSDLWIENHVAIPERFWAQLGRLGLDMDKLYKDMQSEEIARRVKQDMQDAKQLNVNRTPGFFVNGKPLVKFGYEQLKELVASEIKANY